jgi:hypothetical protein
MRVTYLTTIDAPEGLPPDDIVNMGQDIEDELAASGFDVISVVPWARPALGLDVTPPETGGMGPPMF